MSEPVSEPASSEKAEEAAPAPAFVETTSPPPVPLLSPPSEQALWLEVAAVLAVGVFPWLFTAISSLVVAAHPRPYWEVALSLIGHSLCIIFVVLYLIHRSGETWETFGLSRPQLGDLGIAVALVMADFALS